jgi:hypothetical protein
MGRLLSRLRQGFGVRLRRFAALIWPRCFVLVIFGDGSFLVAKFSRLEPVKKEFAMEGEAGRCQLAADLGALRVYRYLRATPRPAHAPASEIVH